jgi:hypothetical protein
VIEPGRTRPVLIDALETGRSKRKRPPPLYSETKPVVSQTKRVLDPPFAWQTVVPKAVTP